MSESRERAATSSTRSLARSSPAPLNSLPSLNLKKKLYLSLHPQASPADLWHGDEAEAHLSQLAVLENFAAHGMFVKFTDEEAGALEGRALAIALAASKDVASHGTTAATLRVNAPAASRGAGGFGAPLPVSLPAEPLGRDGAEAVLKSLRPTGAVVDLPSSSSFRPGSARKLLGGILGGKKGASVSAETGGDESSSVEKAAKPFDEAEVAAAVAARRAEIEAELALKLAAEEAASIRRREKEEAAEHKRVAAEKAAEEKRVAAEALAAKKREEARLRAEAAGAKQKEAFEAAERKRQELELKKEQAAKAKADADEAKRVAAAEAAKAKEEAARVAAIAKAEADKELAARKLADEKAAAVKKAEQEKEAAAKKKAAAEAAALKKAAADKAAAERKEAADKAAAERKEAADKAAAERKAAAGEFFFFLSGGFFFSFQGRERERVRRTETKLTLSNPLFGFPNQPINQTNRGGRKAQGRCRREGRQAARARRALRGREARARRGGPQVRRRGRGKTCLVLFLLFFFLFFNQPPSSLAALASTFF